MFRDRNSKMGGHTGRPLRRLVLALLTLIFYMPMKQIDH
jgi:hypothetical protein